MEKNENLRQLIEMAVNYGRKRKSPQTGYIHYCYGTPEHEQHLPIPLLENFLYALALLRTRLVENVNEAKALLDGLPHFQNRGGEEEIGYGNFPIYLHEFPVCKDRFRGMHIAAVIVWILRLFHQVLGQELRSRLQEALQLVIQHSLKVHNEKAAPYVAAVKLAATTLAAGRFLNLPSFEAQGVALLEALRLKPDELSWYCSESLGELLTALVMVYPRVSESPWSPLWKHVEGTWHHKTACYAGPAVREWQVGKEPQTTVYDLFLGYVSGTLSSRMLKESRVHLEAALIPPLDDPFQAVKSPSHLHGKISGASWLLVQEDDFAYSAIDQGNLEINPIYVKGFHPFRLVWGDAQRVHTFAFQGGNASSITFKSLSKTELEIAFTLEAPIEVEDREKCREICCYWDAHENIEFLVDGQKASTFKLGETVSVQSGSLHWSLKFETEDNEARFLGHRMLANRPSQLEAKGAARYDAHDWLLFLRTINRSASCRVIAHLKI